MNKYQNAKLDSYKLVVKEARNNKQTTDLIPKFAKGIDRLEVIVTELDKLKTEQEADITGIAEDKGALQEELSDYVLDVAGAVHSYAQSNKDFTLMARVNFKPTSIERMNQHDLISAAETTRTEAAKLPLEVLAEEGISAQELAAFTKLIEDFRNIKPAPREAIIDRSSVTERVKGLFTEAQELIKGSLERLASQYKKKNPDFYLKYKAARNIIYPRATNTAGNGKTNLV